MNGQARDTVNLCEVVRQAGRGLQSEFDKRKLLLRLDLPPDPIFVRADTKNIELAVIELLANAMDHAPSGGTVRLGCRMCRANNAATISVEDDGPGVPEGVKHRVFDLFFTTKPRGTGIGLASVKRIAQVHGGDIRLEAPDHGGARFVMTIPIGDSMHPLPIDESQRSVLAVR